MTNSWPQNTRSYAAAVLYNCSLEVVGTEAPWPALLVRITTFKKNRLHAVYHFPEAREITDENVETALNKGVAAVLRAVQRGRMPA